MKITKYILPIIFILFFLSCEEEKIRTREIREEDLTKEITLDIKMVYSDSATAKMMLESPRMESINKINNKTSVFPLGLKLTIFDSHGNEQSTITCDYAEKKSRKNLTVFRGNVVLKNATGDRMETEEMFYDEKKSRIYSNNNTFVSFSSKGNTINGYGFESFDEFKHHKVYNIVNSVIKK